MVVGISVVFILCEGGYPKMKVSELIEKLSKYPGDIEVYVYGDGWKADSLEPLYSIHEDFVNNLDQKEESELILKLKINK